MTERFTSDLVFILIVLLVAALLGILIGYLIRRYKHLSRKQLEDEIAKLNVQLEACQREKQSLLASGNKKAGIAFNADAASKALGYKVLLDDLKIIEGIGEKIESILKERGIDTWLKLSQADPEKIKEILLEVGGAKYNVHEPKTWPKQSLLAYEGKWTELKKYQDELNAGK